MSVTTTEIASNPNAVGTISLDDDLFSFKEIPACVTDKLKGRISTSMLYRWVNRGSHGVRLEFVQIGGQRYTSMDAIKRFIDLSSEPAQTHGQ